MAEALGQCGATVYVVGRTSRRAGSDKVSVEEVAERIDHEGGHGIAHPCDLADDAAVEQLLQRVTSDHRQIDLVVNNAVGWSTDEEVMPFMMKPAWEMPTWWWDANFVVGVRSHYTVTKAAAPHLAHGGLVLFTSEIQPPEPGLQELVLDLRATTVGRMALIWSLHLRPRGVGSILLYPGFTRTEDIEAAFQRGGGYFEGWTEQRFFAETASIYYAGRAAAALAADPNVMARSGTTVAAADLAREFDFTDVTGEQPTPI